MQMHSQDSLASYSERRLRNIYNDDSDPFLAQKDTKRSRSSYTSTDKKYKSEQKKRGFGVLSWFKRQ